MLTVGKDSYVTLEEACAYVESMHGQEEGTSFRANTDAEALLRQGCALLESLNFKGRKVSSKQELSFPRYSPPAKPLDEVPNAIKNAQVEIALAFADKKTLEQHKFYEQLKAYGIKSYSMGSLSESFGSSGAALSCATSLADIPSMYARQLLQRYLVKGVSII